MRNRALRLLLPLLWASAISADRAPSPSYFWYGASTYPELQNREEWNRMLDYFQQAHFKVVRVAESSWGNLETGPGKYNFGWLQEYLDDVQRHGLKAIVGTSSYIPPQWLIAIHPDMLVVRKGVMAHPMSRHSPCLNDPLYREEVRRYVAALARAFKTHPAVIAWQLDNEAQQDLGICYNAYCERAWTEWLKKTYHSGEELNQRWMLQSWGMKVDSLTEIPQYRPSGDGPLPALELASKHFRRDVLFDFLNEQAQTLRDAGVRQPILTDWNPAGAVTADDPLARSSFDLTGMNFYPPSAPDPQFYRWLASRFDMHRSALGRNDFLVTETRVGVAGDTAQWDPFPSKDQFRMWVLSSAAYGASGLLYWSGNRWRAGHWPQWGGVLDWTGHVEPDFPWLVDLGTFFEQSGGELLHNPVQTAAAVLTDYDQRSALEVYPQTKNSSQVLTDTFDDLHRLGIGVESMNFADAGAPGRLAKYRLVLVPAAVALDEPETAKALQEYVEAGGTLIFTPFTDYETWDGLYRGDGFGANFKKITGTIARTGRRMGSAADAGRSDEKVEWLGRLSPVGVDGYCEFLDAEKDVEILGRFRSRNPILNGRPAAVRRLLGKGTAIQLAFWPQDDSLLDLIRQSVPMNPLLSSALPHGLQAVPRTGGGLFIINTLNVAQSVQLTKSATDRISGVRFQNGLQLKPYGVVWLN